MNEILNFKKEVEENIAAQGNNAVLKNAGAAFMEASVRSRYSYNFTWLGRPIIQYPQDILAIQEIIYRVQPDLIIETGIAHGGSLILHASICELIGKGEVLGIDIDIREHNKTEILNHRMINRISMIQGSSVAPDVINSVKEKVKGKSSVMVILDSNHTHEHVVEELKAYAPFVTKDSYLIVLDTIIEDLPGDFYQDRPWGIGNNPKTAVFEFLSRNKNFMNDFNMDNKLMISVAPNGYLKRKD
ncbi:MAG: cephalosporin hydroxylase family protein [Saprospiraceae bacterium]|nr:cephalosporin hydroxylase family protein [Saprospiraceae bacterium]